MSSAYFSRGLMNEGMYFVSCCFGSGGNDQSLEAAACTHVIVSSFFTDLLWTCSSLGNWTSELTCMLTQQIASLTFPIPSREIVSVTLCIKHLNHGCCLQLVPLTLSLLWQESIHLPPLILLKVTEGLEPIPAGYRVHPVKVTSLPVAGLTRTRWLQLLYPHLWPDNRNCCVFNVLLFHVNGDHFGNISIWMCYFSNITPFILKML